MKKAISSLFLAMTVFISYSQNGNVDEEYGKADVLCQKGDFNGAIAILNANLPTNESDFNCDKHAKLSYLKSLALLSIGNIDGGIKSLSLILDNCKDSDHYYLALDQRARVNYHLKNFSNSKDDWEVVLNSSSTKNKSEIYLMLYVCYISLNDNYGLKNLVERVLASENKTSTNYFIASDYHINFDNDKSEGLNYLSKALSMNDVKANKYYADINSDINDMYKSAKSGIETNDLDAAKENIVMFNNWAISWEKSILKDSLNYKSKSKELICFFNKAVVSNSNQLVKETNLLRSSYNSNKSDEVLSKISANGIRLKKNVYKIFPVDCNEEIAEIETQSKDLMEWIMLQLEEKERNKMKEKFQEWVDWNNKQPWASWTKGTYHNRAEYNQALASFFASTEWVGGSDDSESKTIRKGKRGGKYYVSSKGNRVYVPRSTPHQAID